MKSMYSLPSSSMRVEPVPRAIASPAMRAKDWLPGATCSRSWATMRCDRGPTSRRSVMVAGAARPEDSVGGLRQGATWLRPSHHSPFQRGGRPEDSVGGLRQGATWLRPSWHYSFHCRPGVQEPERQVGRDARRRLVAVEREARPGVHVQQHGRARGRDDRVPRSEEHTSELQSRLHLVCRLLLEKKKISKIWWRKSNPRSPRRF